MTKILAVGCSYTRGHGLALESSDPKLWVNQLANQVFDNPIINNRSQSGANNQWIFLETATAITQQDYDVVVVGWTDVGRFNFNLGLELYATSTQFRNYSINIHPNIMVAGKWLEETGDRLRAYQNDHWGMLELVKYVNILYHMQVIQKKSKLFFVNSLIKISDEYFRHSPYNIPTELDPYVREILQIETRDDKEIKQLYNMLHEQYDAYGGIREAHWLNLYQSLKSMQVDTVNTTDVHPGYASQDSYTNCFVPLVKQTI